MELILVPKGTTSVENGNITVDKDFHIGKYEVTQAEWYAVMTGNANNISATPSYFSGKPDNPVEQVSWYDCLVFCNRLSISEGLTPVYSISGSTNPDSWGTVPMSNNTIWNAVSINSSANGYRLPTNAKWEYAARGGANGLATIYAGSDSIGDVAWYSSNSGYKTHAVGTKSPNELGIYDMTGNLWEWTETNLDSRRYSRGGSWYSSNNECKIDVQTNNNANNRVTNLGFRVCRGAIETPIPPSFNSISIDTIKHNSANLNVNLNKNGKVYYKLELTDDNFTVSSESIKGENNYVDVTANVTSIKEITTYHGQPLTPNTAYDLFLAAEDTAGNLQDTSTKIQFQTLVVPIITVTSSLPSGTYTAPQTIELSCATEGTEIRYLAYNKGEEPEIETVDMSQTYNLYTEPFVVEDSDWNVCIFIQAFLNGDAISDIIKYEYDIKFVNLLEITTNKNILHFNILNFEEGKKYFLFLVQNNSLIKIYESSLKEFDISFKFDTEYNFCICDFYEGVTGRLSDIITVKTPIEKIIMPYGKTNYWQLNKNLIDEIYNFNFSSEKKKFQKFEYEYFLQSKKDNKYAAICNKRFADYFSFAIKMNLVILEQGNLCKIISNCSEDNFYGWAIMNVKDEIFLRYNGFKTKNIKIPQNKKIELIVEFNNNNYINFYLEKELILVTKKLGDIIYNSDCYIRIGDKISDSNSSFLINKIELFNGIFTNDFIANPNIISIKNKKNANIIKFTEVPESSFYKVLRSENKFGKYKEIGIVEKTDE